MKNNIIDVQAHFAPLNYLHLLEKRSSVPYVRKDGDGYIFLYGPNSSYYITKESYDISFKLKAMDEAGIRMQLISTIIPGAEILNVISGNEIAHMVNNELYEIISEYPGRFTALATLSYRDIDFSIKELERASKDLNFKGILLFSNICGESLSDKKFWPLYEALEFLNIPIFIHPTRPVMAGEVQEYGLESMVGYMYDTSLAVIKMVFSGVFERYSELKLLLPHAGGVLPYLLGRIDYQSGKIPGSRKEISMEPSFYIKKLYTDTVCMSEKTLLFALDIFGPEQILFATDFPYCEIKPAVDMVYNLKINDREKDNILFHNAEKLLKL